MPRSNFRSEVLSQPSGRAVFASARNMSVRGSTQRSKDRNSGDRWQEDCWRFYDVVGEYHYAVNWVGNLLSRARLTALEGGKPTSNADALDALEALFGGPDGQSEMLRQLGIQFTVTGEAYILGVDSPNNEEGLETEDDWYVVAATELSISDGKTRAWGGDLEVEGDHLLIRMWRPHPQKALKSDAPSRSVIPVLAEIEKLTMHVSAQIDSRLAGAGLLLLPSEMAFASRSIMEKQEDGSEISKEIEGVEAFIMELISTMNAAIADRRDASALTPIVLQVPSETLDKIKHLTFWSGLDEHAIELRTEAIRRLGLGLDMPPEVLTGTGDMNHWGAWQVDESAIKSHSEPLLVAITSALTTGYLRPYLVAQGMSVEDARNFSFGSDTSAMRTRPNRSKEAVELYDRGELTAEAMRRENGFEEVDAPVEDQVIEWFLRKVASGSTTPDLVASALRELGVQIVETPAIQVEETQEARPTRSTQEHPTAGPPESAALLAASEQMVFRALERLGNKVKNRMKDKPSTSGADVYLDPTTPALTQKDTKILLADAWAMIDRFDYGVPAKDLAETLDSYVSDLVTMRKPHSQETLSARLENMKGN